jgi:hypothetical protein
MNNFQLLARNVDVMPLLHQLQVKKYLWNENTLRTKHPGTAHSQVSDIWVLFNELPKDEKDLFQNLNIVDDKEAIPYRAWSELPAIRSIIFGLMRQVEATRLGRVIITKLPPGKTITPHVDQGAPATYYERYQVILQSLPGCIFKIGNEEVQFSSGEIWHIDNKVEHSVINHSADDRIAMIVDLKVN